MGVKERVSSSEAARSEEEAMMDELLAPVDKEMAEIRLKLSKGKLDQASMVAYRDRLKELEGQRNYILKEFNKGPDVKS